MATKDIWAEIYRRFDPERPASSPAWRAPREHGLGRTVRVLDLPIGTPRILLTGTTGTGKSTELFRIASERAGRDLVVLVDLYQHFADTVEDAAALKEVEPWEVVFLAGLAIARAAKELSWPFPELDRLLAELEHAWQAAAKKAGAPPEHAIDIGKVVSNVAIMASTVAAAATGDAAIAVGGGLQTFASLVGGIRNWSVPLGKAKQRLRDQDAEVQSLLASVNAIAGHVQSKASRLLLIIDGLDRIDGIDEATRLFVDSTMIARIDCPLIVVGPLAFRSNASLSAVRGFSNVAVLANEPVVDKLEPTAYGPGIEFFCELFERRTRDLDGTQLVPKPLLEKLAYYSGGRARDFVGTIRKLSVIALMAGVREVDEALVNEAIDEARREREHGLDKGDIAVLEEVARDPDRRLPPGDVARHLLKLGALLPYPNESEWYYPHPLLTMHLVRTRPRSSSG